MKNLITLIAVAAIAFTSCTSTKNGLVMKRKYNKGYYVSHNHKKNNVESVVNNTENKILKTEAKEVAPVLESIASKIVSLELATANTDIKNMEIKSFPKMVEMKHNTIVSDSKNVTASSTKTKIKATHTKVNSVKSTKSKAGSDNNTILLIILCLFPFINLIAMFLKDGSSITLNFWVCLILDVLFLLPGIIFALLVVLDVINLA